MRRKRIVSKSFLPPPSAVLLLCSVGRAMMLMLLMILERAVSAGADSVAATPPAAGFELCLADWKGTRVLTKPPGHDAYLPGCIKLVRNNRDVGIQFDDSADQAPVFFNDVVEQKCVEIICDQAPMPEHVKLGTVVCARRSADDVGFRRAEVIGLSMQPVSFQVTFPCFLRNAPVYPGARSLLCALCEALFHPGGIVMALLIASAVLFALFPKKTLFIVICREKSVNYILFCKNHSRGCIQTSHPCGSYPG